MVRSTSSSSPVLTGADLDDAVESGHIIQAGLYHQRPEVDEGGEVADDVLLAAADAAGVDGGVGQQEAQRREDEDERGQAQDVEDRRQGDPGDKLEMQHFQRVGAGRAAEEHIGFLQLLFHAQLPGEEQVHLVPEILAVLEPGEDRGLLAFHVADVAYGGTGFLPGREETLDRREGREGAYHGNDHEQRAGQFIGAHTRIFPRLATTFIPMATQTMQKAAVNMPSGVL